MRATHFAALIAAVVVVSVDARGTGVGTMDVDDITYYDCSGKLNGNYPHPYNCNQFITCSNGRASERDCAPCPIDPVRCPDGRTVYNQTVDACLWADETACSSNGAPSTQSPSTTTAVPTTTEQVTSAPPSTQPPTTSEAPEEGEDCDPLLCKTNGTCQHYVRCDKVTKKLVKEKCDKDLYWNPRGSGLIHGGNCEGLTDLPTDVLDEYLADENCRGCFWREIDECSSSYEYKSPNSNPGSEQTLTCPGTLVFDVTKETCVLCENKLKADGKYCC